MFSKLKVTLCAVLLMFLAACCTGRPVLNNPSGIPSGQMGHAVILISDDFSTDDVDLIKEGINMWVEASRGLYTVEYVPLEWRSIEDNVGEELPSGRCIDVIVFEMLTSLDARVKEMDAKPGAQGRTRGIGVHNSCDISRAWLIVDRLHEARDIKHVAAHEMGHAIGLMHVDARGSIMYRSVGDFTGPCLTRDDMVEFCNEFMCDVEQMQYCTVTSSCFTMP